MKTKITIILALIFLYGFSVANAGILDWIGQLYSSDKNIGAPPVLYVSQGGTGTSTTPIADQMLIGGSNSRYDVKTLTAGTNVTIDTTGGLITISSSGGVGGVGTVSTSTIPTIGNLSYWTSAGYPSLLGTVATTSLTANSPLSLSQPISVIGSAASALSIDLSSYLQTASFGTPFHTYFSATNTDALSQGSTNLYNQTHTGDVTGATALTIGASKVLDTMINFGTGATQINTADIPELTNLYYTDTRARAAISSSAAGLTYTSATGVLSLTANYSIPLTASTTEGSTAFTWGNHASAGYLTTVDISADTNLTAGVGLTLTGDDVFCDTASGSVFGCLTSANWTTFNNKVDTTVATLSSLASIGTITTGTWNGTSILPAYGGTGLTAGGLKATFIPFGAGTSAFATSSVLYFSGGSLYSTTFVGALTGTASGNLTSGSIDTYSELNTMVADVTLTHNGLIDTFAELDAIVANKALVNKADGAVWLGVHDFGGATSLEIPNAAAPTVDAAGEMAIDTTSGQLKIYNGSAVQVYKPERFVVFGYATSTAWTGTTTLFLAPAYIGETWTGVKCETNAGTLNVSIGDGTNYTNMLTASTTIGTFSFTTNNTFTASESRRVNIGTPVSSPTKISCKAAYNITQD